MSLSKSITASRLRLILSSTLVLIGLAGVGIFYLAYIQLGKTASEVGERVASAEQSQNTLQRLQSLETELESKRDIIETASQVAANSQNYAYQDRLVNDLTVYANRANLVIKNISFTTQAASPTTAEVANPDIPGGASVVALKKATVDITLESPVNYQDLLNFLHYIEQNLTKLKVSRVVMTKSEGDDVTIDILNLEVYVR